MTSRTAFVGTAGLCLVAATAVWTLVAVIQTPVKSDGPIVPQAGASTDQMVPQNHVGIPAETVDFLTRPLFERTRRPPAPPLPKPVVAVQPAPPPPPVPSEPPPSLIGIIITDTQSLVLVRTASPDDVHVLRTGEEWAGWRVGAITPASVTFVAGAQTQEIPLFTPPGQAAVTAPFQPAIPQPRQLPMTGLNGLYRPPIPANSPLLPGGVRQP